MKKILLCFLAASLAMFACNSDSKTGADTPASLAQKWCDLNGVAHKAAEGPAKDQAVAARQQFEKEMEEKYKNDKEFMDKVQAEAEKCEDASEGR